MEPTSTSITALLENIEASVAVLANMAEDSDVSAMLTDEELDYVSHLNAIIHRVNGTRQ